VKTGRWMRVKVKQRTKEPRFAVVVTVVVGSSMLGVSKENWTHIIITWIDCEWAVGVIGFEK